MIRSIFGRLLIVTFSVAVLIITYLLNPLLAAKENVPLLWKSEGYDISSIERLVHTFINAEREKQGLPRLLWNQSLNVIAQRHSIDMAKRNYFSHISPDGADFSDRYKAAHFSCSIQKGLNVFSGAENISRDNLYDSISYRNGVPTFKWKSPEDIARSVVARWMKSPPHRKNILFPHWGSQGIGVSISHDGKVFLTENFC